MYYMFTTKCPPHKAKEVLKIFSETKGPETPKYVKQHFLLSTLAKNIKSYALFEIDNDKVKEGLTYINEILAPYFEIEGYKVTVEPLYTMEDALALFGFKSG